MRSSATRTARALQQHVVLGASPVIPALAADIGEQAPSLWESRIAAARAGIMALAGLLHVATPEQHVGLLNVNVHISATMLLAIRL